jgi:hypothetical protein
MADAGEPCQDGHEMMSFLILACAAPEASAPAAWRERQPPPGPDPAYVAAGADPGAPPRSAKARPLETIDTVVAREPQDVVRFVALGDAGEGNTKQY